MFKSEAQREKMKELLKDGKITQEAYDKHAMETGMQKLPERLHPKKEESETKKEEKPMKASTR